MNIVECVPNFSEGKNLEFLEALKKTVSDLPGCKLLGIEPDADYNRTVVTIAGESDAVLEGALRLSRVAGNYIDMTIHKGEHPRLGAIDVVPFVPVRDASMTQCIALSELYAEAIAKELNCSVFLYEEAARTELRRNLSTIRSGEYEGLAEKLNQPEWKPDFGTDVFNPKVGAIVTGARFFLVAYNVNIASTDVSYSKEIGEILRESGYSKRDENRKFIKVDGKPIKVPGRLQNVKGMGVLLEKYGMSQVSMNLTNFRVTPIHVAFEECKKEAERLGVKVTGSEIVGLVPLEALLDAGKFYAQGKDYTENDLVNLAIDSLGLSDLHPFDPAQKIIDYMI